MTTTPSTIKFEPGAVVRVNIRFTSGAATKKRPAVVLTGDRYHRSRQDAIVVAVTGNVHIAYHGDCDITDWKVAGLAKESKAKGVVQTIDRASVDYQYGNLSATDFQRVKDSLRLILNL
jgi:mRNA-degrading endonuclease toxin of MazEF toxin-antitoxin module